MARTPAAAKTLIRQVRDRLGRKADSKAGLETAQPTDEGDGFGVHREFAFDKVASKGLAETLNRLNDPRIVSVDEVGGQTLVTFTSTTAGDDKSEFALDDVDTVAASEEPVE